MDEERQEQHKHILTTETFIENMKNMKEEKKTQERHAHAQKPENSYICTSR